MRMFYKFLYWIGVKPWEEMSIRPIGKQITALIDREEGEREQPYGPMLDVGCGSGIWTTKLAQRGWTVTGVDIVPKALRAARQRVQDAGVEARLIQGDLATLSQNGVGSGFRFVLDLGCIHGLSDAQRQAAAREITAVTAPGCTMLSLAWAPANRGPLPRGMSREDILSAFAEWDIIDEQVADVTGAPRNVQKSDARLYRLRRR